VRQFCILSIPDPSARSLVNIYQVQLGRFFSENEFNIDIKLQLSNVVLASIVIYYRVFINMLPTPKKSHYIFNLRDLSKLVKGVMQASPSSVATKESLIDLFAHESLRVFNDRFVCEEDTELFYHHLCETVNDYFKVSIRSRFQKQPSQTLSNKNSHPNTSRSDRSSETRSSDSSTDDLSLFLYGDFLKNDERIYQQLHNWKQVVSVLSEYQMRSNMSGKATNQIVFFKEAVEHICR
jgi:dynein heavy chain